MGHGKRLDGDVVMTPELWKMLIGAVVLLLTTGAGLLKVWTEIAKVKADRLATKGDRDKDSLEVHDTLLKQGFQIQQCRDALALYQTVQEDLKTELNLLNTNVAKLTVVVENLGETVKEMRRQ